MNKKLLKSLFIAILAAALCARMLPFAFATHTATVKWHSSSQVPYLLSSYTPFVHNMSVKAPISLADWAKGIWVSINVTDNAGSADGISEIKLVIPRNVDTNEVYFWFAEADLTLLPGWTAVPDEFDPNGYPGVIHFQVGSGSPIAPSITRTLSVQFVRGPSSCTYKFMVYTIDNGLIKSPAETKPHTLYLNLDNTVPNVSIIYPSEGAPIKAIWDEYPDMHYLWINATADDEAETPKEHNSGIKSVQVHVANVTNIKKKYVSGWIDITANKTIKEPEKYYIKWRSYYTVSGKASVKWPPIIEDGTYRVNVTVSDGVGNTATKSLTFKYNIPMPLKLLPDHAHAAREVDTKVKDFKKGLVEATPYEYGVLNPKVLGTTIEATGADGTFNPGTVVRITIFLPTYTWYQANKTTFEVLVREVMVTSAGGFKTTFVCPAAPMGDYQVSAIDAKGNKGYATLTVEPEIIYQPEAVVGPAVIEAVATGLPAHDKVNLFTVDGTDALLGTNSQVLDYWRTNPNGTLYTYMADKPGFLMPVLEPKTYEIAIGFFKASDSIAALVDGKPILVSNKLYVINDFPGMMQLLNALEIKLDDIKPIIDRIDGNVVTIKSDVVTIKDVKLKDIMDSITIIKIDVAEIKTKCGTILGKVDPINWNDIITIKTDVGTIKAKTETIVWGDITTIKTDIGDIKVKLGDFTSAQIATIKKTTDDTLANTNKLIDTTTLGTPMAAVLSAIAAIAAIAAAVVVTRRLKVAA